MGLILCLPLISSLPPTSIDKNISKRAPQAGQYEICLKVKIALANRARVKQINFGENPLVILNHSKYASARVCL